jgi:hypothetical protein
MIPGGGGQVAPGAESTGHAQIMNAFGAPFMVEGLFGAADAEAMDADPDSVVSAGVSCSPHNKLRHADELRWSAA